MDSTKHAPPAWFITGCSTGLGRALAQSVLRHGHRCVVTARDETRIADIVKPYPNTALAVALDVTDEQQRESSVVRAEEIFGGIDVLVNNAGHGYLAAVEEGEEDRIREMFETNFFALAALVRRVLPGMRARGHGHILNISSVGGLIGNPGSGYYSASKFAVEGLSQALAKEVTPLGIRVTVIEPGPFRTDFHGRSMITTRNSIGAYAATAGARRAQLGKSSGQQPGDPVRAADAIIKVVEAQTAPRHLILGKSGVERMREALHAHLRSIDEWEGVSLAADYPEA